MKLAHKRCIEGCAILDENQVGYGASIVGTFGDLAQSDKILVKVVQEANFSSFSTNVLALKLLHLDERERIIFLLASPYHFEQILERVIARLRFYFD